MKASTLFTFLIAMLFVSVVTFGEIVPDGTGTSSGALAIASKGNPEDYDYEEKWYTETTTEAGTFDWYIKADAYAYCSCAEAGGWVLAVADASGACASPFDVVSADAWYTRDYSGWGKDDPPADISEGTDSFDKDECVSGMCDAFAYAGIEEGSDSGAVAYSTSQGYVSLSE